MTSSLPFQLPPLPPRLGRGEGGGGPRRRGRGRDARPRTRGDGPGPGPRGFGDRWVDVTGPGGGARGRRGEGAPRPASAEIERGWGPAGVAAARAGEAQGSLCSFRAAGTGKRAGCAAAAGEGREAGFNSDAGAPKAGSGSGCVWPGRAGDGEGGRTREGAERAAGRRRTGGPAGSPEPAPSGEEARGPKAPASRVGRAPGLGEVRRRLGRSQLPRGRSPDALSAAGNRPRPEERRRCGPRPPASGKRSTPGGGSGRRGRRGGAGSGGPRCPGPRAGSGGDRS